MIRAQVTSITVTPMVYDSSSAIMLGLREIMEEWTELKRKGKIIVHFDGSGPKKLGFDYTIDI